MAIIVGVAVGLIVAGLIICWLSGSAGKASTFFWWLGIVLAVVGAILLLAPVINWLATQLRSMLELH